MDAYRWRIGCTILQRVMPDCAGHRT